MTTRPNKARVFAILLWHHLLFYKRNKCKLFGTIITLVVLLGMIIGTGYYAQHQIRKHRNQMVYDKWFFVNTVVDELNPSRVKWKQMAKSAVPPASEITEKCKNATSAQEEYHGNLWPCIRPFLLSDRFTKQSFSMNFGKILYYPNTPVVRQLMDIAEKALDTRTSAGREVMQQERPDVNVTTINHCLHTGTVGFEDRKSAMSYLRKTEVMPSWNYRYHCETRREKRSTSEEQDWRLPWIMAVIDFTGYSPDNPTYTVISAAGTKEGATSLELAAMMIIDEAVGVQQNPVRVISGIAETVGRFCVSDLSEFSVAILIAVMFTMFVVFPWYALDITKQIIADKQEGKRNCLRAVGVHGFIISCSWSVFAAFFAAFFSVLGAWAAQMAVPIADAWPILIGYLCYNAAQAMFMVLLVSIVGRTTTRLTSLYILILAIGGIVSYGLLRNPSSFNGGRLAGSYVICLFFPAPMILSAIYMQKWAELGFKSYWEVLGWSPFIFDKFGGISACFGMLLADAVLYGLLAMIIESVQEWSFPKMRFKQRRQDRDHNSSTLLYTMEDGRVVPEGTIKLVNVSKTFGDLQVLFGIDIEFPGRKITAFLGQNGAGKSTATNIMAGFLDPTDGSVVYDNEEFHRYREAIEAKLSYLPQVDELYDHLTLTEHIKFYGWLKGLSSDQIAQSMHELDMYDLRIAEDVLGTRLSGGQKRKLGIFIAYLGNPEYVILDEPTSGVDVSSARTIWDVILKRRGSATTIISTHRIEDAEVLADNVVIIEEGAIVATGTPFQLKHEMGLGFSLIIDETGLGSEQRIELKNLISTELRLRANEVPEDLVFTIDHSVGESDHFVELLKKLEERLVAYGAGNYGVSDATIGDVYNEALKRHHNNVNIQPMDLCTTAYKRRRVTAPQRQLMVLAALLQRRFHHFVDSTFTLLYLMVTPIIIALVAGYIVKASGVSGSLRGELNAYGGHRYQTWLLVVEDGTRPSYEQHKFISSFLGATVSIDEYAEYGNTTCTCLTPTLCEELRSTFVVERGNHPFRSVLLVRVKQFNITDLRYGGRQALEQIKSAAIASNGPLTPFPGFILVHHESQQTKVTAVLSENFKPFSWAAILDLTGANSSSHNIRRFFEYGTLRGRPSRRYYGELNMLNNLLSLIFLTFAFPALFSLLKFFVAQDVNSGRKHLLDLSGTWQTTYWISNTLADLVPYIIVVSIMLLVTQRVLPIAQTEDGFPAYSIGVFMAVPYIYLLVVLTGGDGFLVSAGFEEILLVAGVVFSAIGTIATSDPDQRNHPISAVTSVLFHCTRIFRIIPSFFIGNALVLQALSYVSQFHSRQLKPVVDAQSAECVVTGTVFTLVYTTLLLLVQCIGYRVACGRRSDTVEPSLDSLDGDVSNEVRKVRNGLASSPRSMPLAVMSLTKGYESYKMPAVNHVYFSLECNECFGLLGVNGAGKSTTFRMLTGQLLPDAGECFMKGTPFCRRPIRMYGDVAYCPQEDTLFEYLTTSQHVMLFARLAGYSVDFCRQMHDLFLNAMDLQKYSKRKVGKLSGGNKRKVQLVSAVIGCPAVAFLDEPTTGLDPSARQLAWNLIGAIKKNASVLLTSHSLDDCEALCDRLVIMVAGQFSCIGSIQYLKEKLGNKYRFRVKTQSTKRHDVHEFLVEKLGGKAILTDEMPNWLVYEIFKHDLGKLSHLYEIFKQARAVFNIESTMVTQMSLQDVFFKMARDADEIS